MPNAFLDFLSSIDWDESKHKRDAKGRFTSSGGKGSGGKPSRAALEEKKTSARGKALFKQPNSSSRGASENAPPCWIERGKVDYSKLDFESAVKAENAYLQEQTRKTGKEYMSIMNDKKEIKGTWEGTQDSITDDAVMRRLLKISKPNSLSLLHTHTEELSFSEVDIETLCANISVKDVRAVTPNGTEYYISIGKGIRPSKDKVKKKARQVSKALLELDKYKDMKENDERWTSFLIDRNALLQKIYDWKVR